MNVRPLRPTDVVAAASLTRRPSATALTAATWPVVEPGGGVPLGTLLGASLRPRLVRQRAWLAADAGQVSAWAVASPRAEGLAWDVERLVALESKPLAAVDVLDRVCGSAARRGCRRVFLAGPQGSLAAEVARKATFQRYSSSTLQVLNPGFKVGRTDVFEARPRLRADEHDLFLLYQASVPASVRAAEAMTLEEWQGLHRGSRAWRPSWSGTRQQLVWELGATLVGWTAITFGARSQFIELLVHPRYADAVDRLLRYALLQVSPKAPVYVLVHDYQEGLAPALQGAGFTIASTLDHYVRLLAARVAEPFFAPANLVSG